MFKFENVSFMRDTTCILKDINWKVENKENWAILGLNGSGKTTLLKLLNGYIWPSEGNLTVLGEKFGQTSIPELRKKIGWVSTSIQSELKPYDKGEDIVLSGKFASIGLWVDTSEKEREQAKKVLIQCGGENLIGKKYEVLSQGERQIILIARALMAEPELLILDEPCNGLDLFAREKLLDRIEKIAEMKDGPSLLFVTHHTEEIPSCFKNLLLLKEGEVFTSGKMDEILKEEVLSKFYNSDIDLITIKNKRVAVYPK